MASEISSSILNLKLSYPFYAENYVQSRFFSNSHILQIYTKNYLENQCVRYVSAIQKYA